MEWSPQQNEALEAVRKWLDSDMDLRPQVFSLFGYAGTGKTTLAIEIARMARGSVLFATFTGKAALVMRKKGCYGASMIHSLIYKVREDHEGNMVFSLDKDSPLASAALLIIDECSMVGEEIGRDLESFGVPILVLGDPAQLPPVAGGGYFTEIPEPHAMLTEIHRQADGNPIIHVATQVRLGERPEFGTFKGDGGNGAVSTIYKDGVRDSSLLGADQIICGTNAMRKSLNAKMRKMLRDRGELPDGDHMPVVGDRLICLKNKRDRGLFNGGMWHVRGITDRRQDAKKPGRKDISYLIVDSADEEHVRDMLVAVPHQFWLGTDDKMDRFEKKNWDEFDYAYAITCHKSQGSQWDKVLVFDQGHVFNRDSPDIPRRWLYTAITRAADKLIIAI